MIISIALYLWHQHHQCLLIPLVSPEKYLFLGLKLNNFSWQKPYFSIICPKNIYHTSCRRYLKFSTNCNNFSSQGVKAIQAVIQTELKHYRTLYLSFQYNHLTCFGKPLLRKHMKKQIWKYVSFCVIIKC